MQEIWKPITILKEINYESRYSVSNYWRLRRNLKTRRWINKHRKYKILTWSISIDWYWFIALWKNNSFRNFRTNRLVAWAFLWLNIEDEKKLVLHRCEKLVNWKLSDAIHNLWLWTHKDNSQDMVKKKRHWGQWRFWKLNSCSREVDQFTLDWEFIQTWDSQKDAERWTWIKAWNISTSCYKENRNAGWYKWRLHE
jgi:hypothetical protein